MDDVGYSVSAGVASLTLDRPAKRNALTAGMVRDLIDCTEQALSDARVRVLSLGAAGPSFCAGADLSASGAAASAELTSSLATFLGSWARSPKPTLARVQGPVAGGGNGLVAACDVVVASTAASFALREVRVGVVPAVIAIPLRERVAIGTLRELALTGRSIDADEARDIGLVNWVTAPADLDTKVSEVVADLVKGGPAAQAATKTWIAQVDGDHSADLFTQAADLSAAMFSSDEASEGMRAFREKRSPNW